MKVNLKQLLSEARINELDVFTLTPSCVQVGTSNWGTLSNFSAVIGKAKSKKSFLLMVVLAASVKRSDSLISVTLPLEKNRVLYFDTEQSKFHIQRALHKIAAITDTSTETIETYGLRRHPPAVRLALIEEAIYSTPGCGLVVIDGVRDLVTSINDEEQATMITSKLLKWTEEKDIHIIIVLHQNKGDNNARGHVGSEIINKAETVISVNKDGSNPDISIVQVEYAREKEFEPFAFTIDDYGLPVLLEDHIKSPAKKVEISNLTHDLVLNQVFSFNSKPRYKEFVNHLQIYFNKQGYKVGENKAKNFITLYLAEGIIYKEDRTGSYPVYVKVPNKNVTFSN